MASGERIAAIFALLGALNGMGCETGGPEDEGRDFAQVVDEFGDEVGVCLWLRK